MIEVFNPKMCFARELKSSWSRNVNTSTPGKLPIRHVGQETCLVFEHVDEMKREPWFIGSVPINKKWEESDISKLNTLDFNFFTEDTYHCDIYFTDVNDNQSAKVELAQKAVDFGATCNEMSIPLSKFKKTEFNFKKARLLNFVGGEDNCFYISKIIIK